MKKLIAGIKEFLEDLKSFFGPPLKPARAVIKPRNPHTK